MMVMMVRIEEVMMTKMVIVMTIILEPNQIIMVIL